MNAHSPGPWHMGRAARLSDFERERRYRIDSASGRVALVDGEGNAQLLFSAPSLLAACEAAINHFGWELSDMPKNRPVFDQLRAAIARAKGDV